MKETAPVLVVGATGFVGTEICRLLTQQGKKVKALVRSTSDTGKVNALKEMGVETAVGDIKDPASLKNIFQNVGAVITTASSTISHAEGDSIESVDKKGQLNVVEAAEEAGVKQIVYISFLQSPENFPLQDAKNAVERRIQESNMQYTILRPTFFMEIWLGPHLGFDPENGSAKIYGDGTNKISWISLFNVAEFAVASLDNSFAKNKIIDLGGPEALSPLDVVHLFEKYRNKKIETSLVPVEALKAQKESTTDPVLQSFSALMLTYAGGAVVPMEDTQSALKVNLISVQDRFKLN